MDRQYELIITIVNRGFADQVMDAAKQAGARGGTVVYARGAGIHESETFFGLPIQPEKELVLTLVQRCQRNEIMAGICKVAGLSQPGKGLSFSLPVSHAVGINYIEDLQGCKDSDVK